MQAQTNHPASAATVAGPAQVQVNALAAHQTLSINPGPTAIKFHNNLDYAWALSLGFALCVAVALAVKMRKDPRNDDRRVSAYPVPSLLKGTAKFFARHWLIFGAVIGYLIALAICSYLDPGKGVGHSMISGIVPFIGTLVGAGVAFLSDRIKEDKRIEDQHVTAINRALLGLFAQLNELACLNFELQKKANGPAINLNPLAIPDNLGYRVTTDDLAFLVDHGYVQILGKIQTEQRRFDAAYFSVHDRNKIMVDSIQPKIAAAQLNGKFITKQMLVEALGEFDFGRLETSTSNVLENVPSTVESCPVVLDELTKVGKKLFPHRTVLKFDGFNLPQKE